MIKKVFANKSSFKPVEFSPGFNVVLADRTKESTRKDSRNGLGKSTLIEIIHFCLGASLKKDSGLPFYHLKGWEFSIVLQISNNDFTVTRAVDLPKIVTIDGDTSSWPVQARIEKGRLTYSIKEWNLLLGNLMFGLPVSINIWKYQPTFRGIISYFIRRGKDAFATPFEHHRKQKEWSKQVDNAFLLGLDWEDASEIQIMKDRKRELENFKRAVNAGAFEGFVSSLGDLEAQRVRLKNQDDQEKCELRSFKVYPQYLHIEKRANELTEEIHDIVNSNTMDTRVIQLYERSFEEEHAPKEDSVQRLYEEAGVALPDMTLRHLREVREFHETIIENRRAFLTDEIGRLKHVVTKRDSLLRSKADERASIMEILNAYGALEEYTLLQTRNMETASKLKSTTFMIENLKAVETRLSDLKITQQELQQKARRDCDERIAIRERSIALFNEYSEYLYHAPGKLVIDVEQTGFKFDVEIERSGSSGINNMKVFCYDLMLAGLWAEQKPSPKVCVHDSLIFDGVDERQRALALELAAKEADRRGYQYICMLNSDNVPWNDLSKDLDITKYVRLTLTDESVEGCLLGIRF